VKRKYFIIHNIIWKNDGLVPMSNDQGSDISMIHYNRTTHAQLNLCSLALSMGYGDG
jgi:hypothetical protein